VIIRNPWGRMGFDRRNVFEIEPLEDGKFSVPIDSLFKYFGEIIVPASAVHLYRAPIAQTPPRVHQPALRHSSLPVFPIVAIVLCLGCLVVASQTAPGVPCVFLFGLAAWWLTGRKRPSAKAMEQADRRIGL